MPILMYPSFFTAIFVAYTRLARSSRVWIVLGVNSDLSEIQGRFFKKVIGRSPMEYVNEYRIKKAMHYLKESDLTVTEICLECGYNNLGNFLREFRKYTSTTPLQYRKRSLYEIENTDK